ncbi:MAG: hypothetical protein U1A78_06660 [Polyangia bacterium]
MPPVPPASPWRRARAAAGALTRAAGLRLARPVRGGLLVAALLALPSLGRAQLFTVETSAQAPVQDDLAKARARALGEAMSQALEQAVAQAAPEARGRLYLLTARARDYVPTYRVISEGEEAGSFRVRIEAQVDTPRLLRDLQGAAPRRGAAGRRPLQLCVRAAPAEPSPELQAALRQAAELLGERGETVETAVAAHCQIPISSTGARARLVLSAGPAQTSEIRGTRPRLVGAQLTVEWQLERPGDAIEPLRERAESTAFAESAEAAQLAATQQAAQQALRRLCQRPGVLDGTTAGITVSFEGLGSFAAYQQVLRALGALPGVSRLEPRRFVGAATPAEERVQVLVQSQGGSEALGAALGRALLPGLRLQVMPLPGGDLRVLVAPDGALPTGTPEPAAPAGEAPGEPPSDAATAGPGAEKGAP